MVSTTKNAVSYVGLAGTRCKSCAGALFSRHGNEYRCAQCSPVEAEFADEWLEAKYERGVLRWVAALPPSTPTIALAWVYVADNLDWLELAPAENLADLWHVGPMSAGRWFRRLNRTFLAWLVDRVRRLEKTAFPEDFRDALAALQQLVSRAIELGELGEQFSDQSRWPCASGGFDPFGGLPDFSQIQFPGLVSAPVASSVSTSGPRRAK